MADENTPPAGDAADLTPTADDVEWGQANDSFAKNKDFQPGQPKKVEEPKKAEEAKPAEKPEGEENQQTPEEKKAAEEKAKADEDAAAKVKADAEEAEKAKNETPEQTEARHKKEAEEAAAKQKKEEEEPADDPVVREQRQVQRRMQEDERAIKADIRKEMFADVPTELLDADGDPIKSIDDVQKLTNPNTGKPFTEEEAAAWLLRAQEHLKKQQDEADGKIEEIAQANLDIKDWSDSVRKDYGAFIKANPDIWNPIWAEYERTLVKDEKTEIIIKAPVNLKNFVDVALAPHLKLAEQMQKQSEQEQKDKDNKGRQQSQSDRSDILPGGKTSKVTDPEDEEWDKAAKSYYETK